MFREIEKVQMKLVSLKSHRTFNETCLTPFMPTVPTFAVRETDVSRHNGSTSV